MAESGNATHRDTPKILLEGSDVNALAKYMKSDSCRKVFLMVRSSFMDDIHSGYDGNHEQLGAGVSTSAGIPDFRSPGTGLYANLARLNLPFPEAVFEIGFFQRNPVPFYTLAKELYPGHFRPTLTHSFINLLHSHSLLHTCFTQNIDTLERRAGVPENKVVEAHGSFATQRCIKCQTPFDAKKIKNLVLGDELVIPRCEEKMCGGLVKPDIVFFGEALPTRFRKSIHLLQEADLLIVIGTSLTVHPFASLVDLVPSGCPRVLINLEEVGHFNRRNDVVILGKCDEVVRELCRELGWAEELVAAWEETKDSVEAREEASEEKVEEEVEKITKDLQETMNIRDKEGKGQLKSVEDEKTSDAKSPTEGGD